MTYKPYVSQTVGEHLDFLAHMMLAAPTFEDKTGYLRRMNIDTTFISLNEGMQVIHERLGEERYKKLRVMSDKMRSLFEPDPEDKTGDTQAGRMLVGEMRDILTSAAKRKASQ